VDQDHPRVMQVCGIHMVLVTDDGNFLPRPGAIGTLQQSVYQQGELEILPLGPPEQPKHDVQVEQILRKQYDSYSVDVVLDADENY
jgi:hypothetical protein